MHALRQTLVSGLNKLQITLDDVTIDRLLQYQALLAFWNKAYNLTAIRDPKEMLIKHLLDSLAVLPDLPAGRLLDVGTGGGMPGLIIAICQPERACVLLDSNGKKIRFLRQVCSDMGIKNAKPIQARIEEQATKQELGLFDVVTSRAFASLPDFVRDCMPYLKPDGVLAAMKGVLPVEEIAQLSAYKIRHTVLDVPFLEEQRHMVFVSS